MSAAANPAPNPEPVSSPAIWSDPKRYLWLLGPIVPLLVLAGLGIAWATGWVLFAWVLPVILYGVIPALDLLIGTDRSNPPDSAVAQLENDRYYRFIVAAFVPLQIVATVLGTWLALTVDTNWFGMLGLVLAVGGLNGIGINTAHELGHKKPGWERWMAKLALAPTFYGHFFVEHNRGHHKNVATPVDPASSKMGESFWRFLPRTVFGSLRSAWELEKERLARLNKGPWTWDNENLQAWSLTLVLFGGITVWLGWAALPFLLLQAAYGASLLEVVNYLEHYGLLRAKDANGRHVRCEPEHSWNSNHVVTNLFLYQLQRHSDHHAHPTRRYQALRHFDGCPQLPSGYASMILVAYFPPLWFRLMDPKVVAHYGGDLSKANIHPAARERLLARWSGHGAAQGAAR